MIESNNILQQYMRFPDNLFALLSRYHVAIPGIQRHYVQGADTPKAKDIRKNFIQTLFEACCNNQSVHLHFVYGPIDTNGEDTFTPVDGQQRLTTLWLLARYTAEQLPPENKAEVLQLLSRFSYTDRIHATRFCRALTEKNCSWNRNVDPMVSIPRQDWFWDYWMQDETISSMLRMLSTIHENWKNSNAEKMLDFLAGKVTFSLQIDNFADDIYMKMNARGLQLTQWENFKGKFAELLFGVGGKSIQSKWNEKIEKLSNIYFSRSSNHLPDNSFFALMARVAVYETKLSQDQTSAKIGGQIEKLANFTQWDKELPYVPFDDFTAVQLEKYDDFADNVLRLIIFILSKKRANRSPYWQTERTLFQSVFEPQNQNELDLSWLLFAYCRKNTGDIEPEDFSKALCGWPRKLDHLNRCKIPCILITERGVL